MYGLQTTFGDGLLIWEATMYIRILWSIALVQRCMANGVRISPVSDEGTNGKVQKLKRDLFPFLKRKSGMK